MADEIDFNDALDTIFLREEKQYKESYDEGFKAGSAAGNPEGFHLGYHRGAELGRELGYYYGIINHYIGINENTGFKYPEKLINQLTKVKDLIDAYPRENSENQDILDMAENIRAQYKKMRRFLKMDTRIIRIRSNLDSIMNYLTPLLPLANCHMVEFLTQNHWEHILPKALAKSLDGKELSDAVETFWKSAADWKDSGPTELEKWIKNARSQCITVNDDYCLSRDQLQDRILKWGGDIKPQIKVMEFMNSKKSYEIQNMCNLVASLHEATQSTCCIEAGGGRGHLLAALSLSYGVPCVTVDCNAGAVEAAANRTARMKKLWLAIAKKLDGSEDQVSKQDLHRFASAFVTSKTDLITISRECFPEFKDRDIKVLLTGLHTCGNLGPASLRMFVGQRATAAVFNVPCCYHLLTTDNDNILDVFQQQFGDGETRENGFPMSRYLGGFNLGRNARMLAAQSIDRVANLRQLPGKSLLYRALLQVLIKTHIRDAVLTEGKLKRIPKCENFEQYFKMADSILQLNLFDTLTDIQLKEICKDMEDQWKKLVLFYLIRLCLAQVIESVILLDRLLYLTENDVDEVFLVKLFDPVMSPRCHSIVAVR